MPLETVFVSDLSTAQVASKHYSVVVVNFFDVLIEQVLSVEGSRTNLAQEQEPILVVSDAAFCRQHRSAMLVADAALEFVRMINFYMLFLLD